MDSGSKKISVLLILLILATFLLNVVSFKNGHSWGGDFAEYVGLARSLVDGTVDDFMSHHRYRIEHSTLWADTKDLYWGISFLLSPVYYFFGMDIHVMKIYLYIFFLLSLVVIFLLFKNKLHNYQPLLLVAIIGFNPYFFDFKDDIGTDIPYLFTSLLSLYLINRIVVLNRIWANSYASYLAIGISIFLSYFIRPVAIVLLPTLFLVQYARARSSSIPLRRFIFSDKYKFIPYVTFLIFMLASRLALPGDVIAGHGGLIFGNSLSMIILNIKYYLAGPATYFPYFSITCHVFGCGYDKIHLILYIIILAGLILGVIHNRREDYLFIVYIIFNIIVLVIFPGRDKRLLMPIYPFLLYFIFVGFSRISLSCALSSKYNIKKMNLVYIFAVGLMMVSLADISHATYKNLVFNRTEVMDGPYTSDSIKMFNYITANTTEEDSIIFFKPRVMSLYTGRKSFVMNSENFTPDMAFNTEAKYVVINKTKYIDYDLTLEDFQGTLDCEFENDSFFICDLNKSRDL
jgi:hypothetical protein